MFIKPESLNLLLKATSFLLITTKQHTLRRCVKELPDDVLFRMFNILRKDWDSFCDSHILLTYAEQRFDKEVCKILPDFQKPRK